MALKIKAACSKCGADNEITIHVNAQRHFRFIQKDILYTSITLMSGMKCSHCGADIGYIQVDKEEELNER